MSLTRDQLLEIVHEIGPRFAERAAENDAEDRFVAENYAELKKRRLFSATVPVELGGGGALHSDMCAALRVLAGYCSSTALALSMHQHLVAAQLLNHKHGRPGRKVLEKVAAGELVLVSTGANDWLDSNGEMKRVEGGYRVTAKKFFASGSPAGDVLVTSARFHDPEAGAQVLHFPVPFTADGVSIDENWRAHGMRATGSHTVVLEDVFVADEAIALARPAGAYHNLYSIVLTVAMPLISAVYVGLAEAAAAKALTRVAGRDDDVSVILAGELRNALTRAQLALDSMVTIADDLEVEPDVATADAIVIRKTLAVEAAIETVEKAMELVGGGGFYRAAGLERMLRDVRAGHYHPMQAKRQQVFSGRLALGLDAG